MIESNDKLALAQRHDSALCIMFAFTCNNLLYCVYTYYVHVHHFIRHEIIYMYTYQFGLFVIMIYSSMIGTTIVFVNAKF